MAKKDTASKTERTVTEYVLFEDGQGCFSDGDLECVKLEKSQRILNNRKQGAAPKDYEICQRKVSYNGSDQAVSEPEETYL